MIKRVINSIKRRLAEYRVKLNFQNVCYSSPEFHNSIPSPEFVYRDDNSTYISSFIKHEETDITPWDIKNSDKKFKHDNISTKTCPDCGKPMLEVNGKKGKLDVLLLSGCTG